MRQNLKESSNKRQYIRNWIRRRYEKINDLLDNFLKKKLDESFFREYGESKEMFTKAVIGTTYVKILLEFNFNINIDYETNRFLLEELIDLYSNSEKISKVYDEFSKRF